ncbi:MAG TPA: hypothetical protein VML19_10025 [Verrucomicrobiae bacterium]|nr:hypothetical protein [Verrucomicrobiae bacterium]
MRNVLVLLAAVAGVAAAQDAPKDAPKETPSLEEILSRVARNQAKTLDARTGYVYNQSQLLRMIRGNHQVAREEHRDYVVTPKDRGFDKKLAHFEGKYESHGEYTAFDKPGYHHKSLDLDADLLESFSEDMTDDHSSRDGIGHDLFPLTYHQQLKYDFKLEGARIWEGREVYRLSFQPKPKSVHIEDGAIWKGEALIDALEYQPVQVQTQMVWKMPLAVKTLLGTNISGLGFTVTYGRIAEGVWFPVSYGGEFKFRGVFFYERTATISLRNTNFQRTDVTSHIAYATGQ